MCKETSEFLDSSHEQTEPCVESIQSELVVTFDGQIMDRVEPMSAPGRAAWDGMSKTMDRRQHMEQRRMAETAGSPLWRCHGKLYDLDPFLDIHPGGRLWLELTRGTDVTQAFEAYHLDGTKTRAVLEKYFVREIKQNEFNHGERFTYEDSGFFRTLRQRLLERLKQDAGPDATTKQATAASSSMRAACVLVVAQFAAAHCWARNTGSKTVAALCGLFLNGMWGVGHNFMHQSSEKASVWQHAMDADGNYASEFRISHALSHHLDTNLDTDWEHQFLNARYKDPNTAGSKIFVPVFHLLAPIVTPLLSLEQALGSVREGASVPGGRTWSDFIPGLLPILQMASYMKAHGFKQGFILHMIQWATHLALFIPLSLGVHHSAPAPESKHLHNLRRRQDAPRNTFAWKEGQKGGHMDFGEHMVAATTDHTLKHLMKLPAFLRDYLSLTLFGYLNNHTLHHLFPGVDHGRLSQAYDVYVETCREFGMMEEDAAPVPAPTLAAGFYRYYLKRQVRKPRSRL